MIWRPDTCNEPLCILEYSKGLNIPANFVRAHQLCSAHASADDAYTDNVAKNDGVSLLRQSLESLGHVVVDTDIEWSFNGTRRIILRPPSRVMLTAPQRTSIQTVLSQHNARWILG